MTDLQKFIQTTQDHRELKRALAVQNTLAGRPRAKVAAELGVKESFIGMWRWRLKHDGIAGLAVGYKGSAGYLTTAQKKAIVKWIQQQGAWNIQTLYRHIETTYGLRYKSQQSYYALLKEARISWKTSQHHHPDADPAKVSAKRDEMRTKTVTEAPAIILKQTVELAVDECHIIWGDACGSVWGKRHERTEFVRSRIFEHGRPTMAL